MVTVYLFQRVPELFVPVNIVSLWEEEFQAFSYLPVEVMFFIDRERVALAAEMPMIFKANDPLALYKDSLE